MAVTLEELLERTRTLSRRRQLVIAAWSRGGGAERRQLERKEMMEGVERLAALARLAALESYEWRAWRLIRLRL